MSISSIRKRNELRAAILALVEACPANHCNPQDCPLFPLRNLKPRARARWLKALPETDLAYLAAYHHVCFEIKVNQIASERLS